MEPKKKILIADDEIEVVALLKDFIEKNFPTLAVFVASDGIQVMNSLEKIEFDILFLDINIPKLDGRKIVKEINFLPKSYRPRNIFIISGEDMKMDDIHLIGEKRSIFYFGKPIDFQKLKAHVTAILSPSKPAAPAKAALEVKFMNPFIDSTLKVLKVTTGTEAVKEEINISMGEAFKGDISAFYPIHSPIFEGFFCLSFPKQTYLKIMSKMLYTDFEEINEDNRDGVGELCNQIFGNAKAYFNDTFKTQIRMSTPSITIGDNHSIVSILKAPRIVVKFSTESGSFYVEVSMVKVG
jgi:chemotaxis protein CheX